VVEAIRQGGGDVLYDFKMPGAEPRIPTWLRELLGDDFFYDVSAVWIKGDYPVTHLTNCPNLTQLHLYDTEVTDAVLEHLRGFTKLESLCLIGTEVSEGQERELKMTLETVQVLRWSRPQPGR
jgi:hypothetical protein